MLKSNNYFQLNSSVSILGPYVNGDWTEFPEIKYLCCLKLYICYELLLLLSIPVVVIFPYRKEDISEVTTTDCVCIKFVKFVTVAIFVIVDLLQYFIPCLCKC
jgi:hypothetical protein